MMNMFVKETSRLTINDLKKNACEGCLKISNLKCQNKSTQMRVQRIPWLQATQQKLPT